jgi:hypothetical protein
VKRQKETSRNLEEVFAWGLLNTEQLSQDLLREPGSIEKIYKMMIGLPDPDRPTGQRPHPHSTAKLDVLQREQNQ